MSTPVTLRGRLTRDPELSYAKTGTAVANFTVVTDRRFKDKDSGEWTNIDTSFWRCTAFGEFAENICESFLKGTPVIVTGHMKQDDWEDKEGNKRTSFAVTVEDAAVSVRWRTVEVGPSSREPVAAVFTEKPPF